jgi:hypothetical protein
MVGIPAIIATALSTCVAATLVTDSVVERATKESNDQVLRVWAEVRAFVWVALAVFAISVFAQLVFARMMHPSFREFFALHRRAEMFVMTTCLNLVNGFIAGYLAMRVKYREHHWRTRHEEVTGYLNHHVRNALCSIQFAAACTEDETAIHTCNESIKRIVNALKAAENGIPPEDEFLRFQERLKVS